MAKKGKGKKGKKAAKVPKIVPETTKEMVQERDLLKVINPPLVYVAILALLSVRMYFTARPREPHTRPSTM